MDAIAEIVRFLETLNVAEMTLSVRVGSRSFIQDLRLCNTRSTTPERAEALAREMDSLSRELSQDHRPWFSSEHEQERFANAILRLPKNRPRINIPRPKRRKAVA